MAETVVVRSTKDPQRTKTVSQRDARILVKLGRWQYETAALESGSPPKRQPRRRATKPAPEPAAQPESEPEGPTPPTPPAEPTE